MLLDVHKIRTVTSYWWFYQPIHYWCITIFLASVQFSGSVMSWFFVTPWTAAHQASLSITNSRSLLKLMSIKSVMASNHLVLCCPLLLPSIFPSIRLFSSESVLPIRWPKYWSFSFSISLSNEYSGLISFRIIWFDLLAVQGTLKSLLQHHSSKASIVQCSAFFMVQLSHPYMTTSKTKTIALTRWTFVTKVMSLLFNMLSRFVTAFLPRSKQLLISWLHSYKKNCLSILIIWQPTLPDMYSYTTILMINIYLVHCLPYFLLKIFQVLIFKMYLL